MISLGGSPTVEKSESKASIAAQNGDGKTSDEPEDPTSKADAAPVAARPCFDLDAVSNILERRTSEATILAESVSAIASDGLTLLIAILSSVTLAQVSMRSARQLLDKHVTRQGVTARLALTRTSLCDSFHRQKCLWVIVAISLPAIITTHAATYIMNLKHLPPLKLPCPSVGGMQKWMK